jgi:nitroreductase
MSVDAVMAAIRERRSIRRYEDREVPEAMVAQILEAVRWSPSWTNCQSWEVVTVRDAETKQQLQATLGKGNPAAKAMVQAPVVLILCGRRNESGYYKGRASTKFDDWFMYDLGLANQNLCLAAHALGLGTVIVGLFDHDAAAGILGVPGGVDVVTMIPLGYPAKVSKAPRRREVSEFNHIERF